MPGIKKNISHYDRDSDGRISRDEIAARVNDWASQQLALMGCTYVVTIDGQPLADATITLVPEPSVGSKRQAGLGNHHAKRPGQVDTRG